MVRTAHRVLLLAGVAALPLACGGDDGGDGGGDIPEGALVVRSSDSLDFDPDTLDAPAGAITLALDNEGSLPHTLLVEDHEDELTLSVGGSGDVDSGDITLEAGEYTFYCDVPGHRGAGMEGTLTVG
jgi:plastocyanin